MANSYPIKEQIVRKIMKVLREYPEGVTIKTLAEKTGISRNTISKYLDILMALGRIEMRSVGPAKVFCISHRIPIQGIIDFINDGIIVCDSDFKIIQANNKAKEIIGHDKLVGKNIKEIPLFKDRSDLLNALQGALQGKETCLNYIPYQINESLKYIHIVSVPTIFEEGDRGIFIIIYDVTKEYLMRRRLEESEKRYRLLIENVPIYIMLINKEDEIVYINKYMIESRGLKEDDIIGKKFWEFVPEEYINYVKNKKMLLFTTGKSEKVTIKANTRQGNRVFEATAILIKMNGEKYGMVMARDITEEVTLRENQQETIDIMRSLCQIFLQDTAFFVVGEDEKVRYAGGKLDMLGLNEAQVIQKSVSELLGDSIAKKVQEALSTEKNMQVEITISKTSKKKKNLLKGELIPLKINDKKFVVLSIKK